jgi:hypothetical protein
MQVLLSRQTTLTFKSQIDNVSPEQLMIIRRRGLGIKSVDTEKKTVEVTGTVRKLKRFHKESPHFKSDALPRFRKRFYRD